MSFPAAIVAWEQLKIQRDNDIDPALEAKQERNNQREAVEKQHKAGKEEAYTLRILCDDYLNGHINRNRAPKGAINALDKLFHDCDS